MTEPTDMTPAFRRLLTMAAGTLTTSLALALAVTTSLGDQIHSFSQTPFLLPTGAFGLGLLAGSGFALVGWVLTRLRFTRPMLIGVAATMLIAYFGTVLIEFLQHAPDGIGFFTYLDVVTRESVIVSTDAREGVVASDALGLEGYNYRFLELLGLTFGGMGSLFVIPLLQLRARMQTAK